MLETSSRVQATLAVRCTKPHSTFLADLMENMALASRNDYMRIATIVENFSKVIEILIHFPQIK